MWPESRNQNLDLDIFAYAATLNRSHMARLCPGAEPLYPDVLENYILTLRRWFNIEPQEGSEIVEGGLEDQGGTPAEA